VKQSFDLKMADTSCIDRIMPLFRAYQAHYSALTTAGEEQTRTFLAQLIKNSDAGFVVMAESEKTVVGFATGYLTVSGVIAERLVHLGDLYVLPEYRHQGIATTLIDRVTTEARVRGVTLVRWLSLASNTELNRWYESLGTTSGDFKLFLKPTSA
jgi:ribosomal protein S18 acetylase RimI-like enzyme